jgi:sulfate transport system ATP-binding protein
VGDGELFVLLGSSGSGKSTLLRMIAGLPGGGRRADRCTASTSPACRRRGAGVGFVFQSYALFRGMTVAENVEFALSIRGVLAVIAASGERSCSTWSASPEWRPDAPPSSGGQQQRVALARAPAHRPEVLLLDEPFGALDAKVRSELRRTVREVQRELGIRRSSSPTTRRRPRAGRLIGVLSYGRLLRPGRPRSCTCGRRPSSWPPSWARPT